LDNYFFERLGAVSLLGWTAHIIRESKSEAADYISIGLVQHPFHSLVLQGLHRHATDLLFRGKETKRLDFLVQRTNGNFIRLLDGGLGGDVVNKLFKLVNLCHAFL
jgi:hypothetical protein